MPDLLHALPWLLAPLLGVIATLIAIAAVRRARASGHRGAAAEAEVDRALRRLFRQVRHDIILPDGRGGLTQIDHVALTPRGLLVIETKDYRGTIHGQADDATWIQSLGQRDHRFQNPLRQNYAHIKAIEALGLGVPVLGHVVFTAAARFPDGLPDGVSRVSALKQDLAPLRRGRIGAPLTRAWTTLLQQARTDWLARVAHRRQLHKRHARRS